MEMNYAQLPPKKGYAEIEVDGVRQYVPTPETASKLLKEAELQAENALLKAQMQAMSDRNAFTDDCIAEIASVVYS